MARIEVFAPAKINLTLHVTGQRADGYHLLDSLVTFASVGDRLFIAVPANSLSLTVEGPESQGVPSDMRNLALRAAALVPFEGAALVLEKNLPSASGIGGGSADAAAAWRGMTYLKGDVFHWLADAPEPWLQAEMNNLLTLGADIPMCVHSSPMRVQGVGDKLIPVDLPSLPALLANPRLPVSTPSVFKALKLRDNPPMPAALPEFFDVGDLIDWLSVQRNDLQDAALCVEPGIAEVLSVLSALPGCRLARMSGSGATCFGLFETEEAAKAATYELHKIRPEWWKAGCLLGDQMRAAVPRDC
ncbi:4-(cytidine 5'-diphospho)-2-C-methyl-D-erythritol kinase [Thalassococcus sp. CAU 1522]|uniref:4-diphosphocytidyl-2-C-methyl-D-erythritol kinase n=1 Tax=Thalassococcus arenae TaxID=2851652 RepID=A0ABS6N4V0_9RHOB|nr:4-(cytidine 5'-diphospho)-2-C-methyl-D-erythritol kinase [Thalassococcus arenae]MBV2359035.1 4-(cytidine 5'-diphospho)-2-C-methyl-D-erythritol kinase [Thalassococcus arenae]